MEKMACRDKQGSRSHITQEDKRLNEGNTRVNWKGRLNEPQPRGMSQIPKTRLQIN